MKHKKRRKRVNKKTNIKGKKSEVTEDQGSSTLIASFHSLLSNANSLVIYYIPKAAQQNIEGKYIRSNSSISMMKTQVRHALRAIHWSDMKS
jgi:hypothetical protein